MGAELLATEPVFAATVAEVEPLIARESGFSVTEAISAPETVTGIDRIQPALFTMQVALAATMRAYGVQPGAVIGHSMGEAAAAVVAGALSLEDGVRVICRRSRLMSTHRWFRGDGVGGTACRASAFGTDGSRRRRRRAGSGGLAAVHGDRRRHADGARSGHSMGATRRVGPRDRRRCRLALPTGRSDPRRAVRRAGRAQPHDTGGALLLRDRCSTRASGPCAMPGYWSDNLRHMVRFAAAVQAALEDGYRVFAELAPHPLLTHAVEQTAAKPRRPLAALAAMRREQELPHGLRGFLADLYSAGAAVDFSVIYPGGRWWMHRYRHGVTARCCLTPNGQDSRARGACTVPVHPLMGAHVRLHEEPERHVWQGEVGTAAQPWLGDHRIHNVAVLPGAAYCEMACAAARTVLGEKSEVRDIRFEETLLLDDKTPVSAVASVTSPGVVDFVVETNQDGEHTIRRATAVLHAGRMRTSHPRTTCPPYSRPTHAGWMGPRCGSSSTSTVCSMVRLSPDWPQCTAPTRRSAQCWPRSGCPARSARNRAPTACTRLAGCLFPFGCGSFRRPGRR